MSCVRKGDDLLICSGFVCGYPQMADLGRHWTGVAAAISLQNMEQIFPTLVDDVDPADVVASEVRPTPLNRPWLMCNMISSIDGAISIDGVSASLGGPGDKAMFSAIRALADVIVVASGTVIAENYRRPQTSQRHSEMRIARGQSARPRIAIVTGSLSIDPRHRVFDPEARPLIITHNDSPRVERERLADVADVVAAGQTSVDLEDALAQLARSGVNCALLEGGPTLNGAFARADLIDEWCLSSSPLIVGGNTGRAVVSNSTFEPRRFRLERTLHDDGYLFHRYVRDRTAST